MDPTSEWRSRPHHLDKVEKGQFGQEVRSTYEPLLGVVRILETFPDGSRRLFGADKGAILKSLVGRPQAGFPDKENKSYTKVDITSLGNFRVHSFRFYDIPNEPLGAQGSQGFSLFYKEGKLAIIDMQAELAQIAPEEEKAPWMEKIKELINLAKSTDDESLDSLQEWIDESRNRLIERGLPEDLIDHAVRGGRKNIPKVLVQIVDPKDIPILDKLGLFEGITYRILENPHLSYYDVEVYIDRVVNDFMQKLLDISSKIYSRTLEVMNVGDKGFDWRELDKESGTDLEVEVLNQGKEDYGNEIQIDRYKFAITKEDGVIKVTCRTQKDNTVWVGKFPVSIPAGEIARILNDPKADFRVIKDMLGASLVFA